MIATVIIPIMHTTMSNGTGIINRVVGVLYVCATTY